MSAVLATTLAALTVATTDALSVRDAVPFDYGWRFQLEGARTTCPAFTPAPGTTCTGLKNSAAGQASAAACRQACCNNSACRVWQWTNASDPRANERCWIGQCDAPFRHGRQGWVGGFANATDKPWPEVNWTFPDGAWPVVEVPHDYIITLPYSNDSGTPQTGYFPRANAFYRKHFRLPDTWRGERIQLRFEGVYKVATVFVNDALVQTYGGSDSAYTEFIVRLDNLTEVHYGNTSRPNVVAIHVDGSYGTEHWYSGAGIYRSVHLERYPATHIGFQSFFVPSVVAPGSIRGASPAAGAASGDVEFLPEITVVNEAPQQAHGLQVLFRAFDANGTAVGQASSSSLDVPAGGERVVSGTIDVGNALLWSVQTPSLYTVEASIMSANGALVDSLNITTGARTVEWDANRGMYLNGARVKLRGMW